MTYIYLDKTIGQRIGNWGGTFSATHYTCYLICNNRSISIKQAEATIAQLQAYKKYIWDNIETLPHPQCGYDIRELNQLIDAVESAIVAAVKQKQATEIIYVFTDDAGYPTLFSRELGSRKRFPVASISELKQHPEWITNSLPVGWLIRLREGVYGRNSETTAELVKLKD